MSIALKWITSRRSGVVLLATLAGVALALRLGAWQLDRAAQKEALQASLDSRAVLPALSAADLALSPLDTAWQQHRRVRLQGRWRPEHTVFLENRQMNGRTGFYVVTPLQLDPNGDAVLVQRGWVPRNMQDRTLLPTLATPAGEVVVDGTIAPPPARLYEFAAAGTGLIRQNLDIASFAAETGSVLRPLSVLQADPAESRSGAAAAADGLLRQWPRPAAGVEKHYGYAFQWLALAALMTGLYVWFQLVRPRLRRDA